MSIHVICTVEERNEVSEAISTVWGKKSADFLSGPEQLKNITGIVLISHRLVTELKAETFSNMDNIYLYFGGNIIPVKDEEHLIHERDEAVKDKNWGRAKNINEVLIDINFLNKSEYSTAMPDYLQIETTSRCNAECIMCSHYFSDNKDASCLENNTLDHIADAIELSHTISLNGMGEPFVSPAVSDQIDFYANLGNKVVTNTNLSVMNERLLEQINSHFEWLEISCDGATKETYESIRKNLKFDVILKNLMLLKVKCPNVRKHIATVIMRQNVHEMPQMVELASKAGASIITFMTLNANIIINNQKDEMCNYPKVLEYYSARALKRGEELGIPVIVPNMHILNRNITFEEVRDELEQMNQIPKYKSDAEVKDMKKTAAIVDAYLAEHDEIQRDTKASTVKCHGICDWILKQSYIDLKGNVAMCCRNQSFHTGNVNETGDFAEVWNSEFYRKLRRIFYSGYIPESCLKCGLIESGNLKHLDVEISDDFYRDAEYKVKQKKTLKTLLDG